MIIVELRNGNYHAVGSNSFGMLMRAIGYAWFPQHHWQWVAERVREDYDARLTNRWYHIQRAKRSER